VGPRLIDTGHAPELSDIDKEVEFGEQPLEQDSDDRRQYSDVTSCSTTDQMHLLIPDFQPRDSSSSTTFFPSRRPSKASKASIASSSLGTCARRLSIIPQKK
jgi:hypothetical protein